MKKDKKIINEDLAGAGYYGPHGYMVYGDMGKLIKGFSEPFKNLFGVVKGESKKLFSAALMSFKVAVGALANMIPGIKTDFDAIFGEHSQNIKDIKKEYSEFYEGVAKTIDENSDLGILTFLWNPGLVMTGKVAGKVPGAFEKISDFFKDEKNEVFSRWSTLINENSQLVPDDLRKGSLNYRDQVKSSVEDIQKKVENVLKMPEEQFVKTYAKILGNEQELYKNIQKQIEKTKSAKDVDPEQVEKVVSQLTSKMTDIVKLAKNKYREAYVNMLNSVADANASAVEKYNVNFGLNISPEQHGLSPFLREAAKNLLKLEIK